MLAENRWAKKLNRATVSLQWTIPEVVENTRCPLTLGDASLLSELVCMLHLRRTAEIGAANAALTLDAGCRLWAALEGDPK